MITLAKLASSIIENGKRILKLKQFGVKTAKEVSPFGFDSQAPEGWTAIYAETSNKEDAVVIGYVQKNALVEAGEARLYALGSMGEVVGYVWSKKSGVTGINGFDYSAVRYENLETKLNELQSLINAQLTLIQSGISTAGGSYTPTNLNVNFTTAKSETVKLK